MPETLAPGQEPLSLEGYLSLERAHNAGGGGNAGAEGGAFPAAPASEAQVRGLVTGEGEIRAEESSITSFREMAAVSC